MTLGGWFTMIVSVGGVTAFFSWTLYMVLRRRGSAAEHLHSVHDEPPDLDRE
jgi:hypothetical protein